MGGLCALYHQMVPDPPVPVAPPPPHHQPPEVHLYLDGVTKRRTPAAALQQATTTTGFINIKPVVLQTYLETRPWDVVDIDGVPTEVFLIVDDLDLIILAGDTELYVTAVTEGLYLYRMQLSPYDGDIFHEPPLSLIMYDYVTKTMEKQWIPLLFIACDLVTALLLALGAKKSISYMVQKEAQVKKAKSAKNITLTMKSADAVPKLVLAVTVVDKLKPSEQQEFFEAVRHYFVTVCDYMRHKFPLTDPALLNAEIFLITDLLFAHVKRNFYLENGDPKELEEKNMKLELR
ncbi:hypothetical protein HPB51_022821 [Rhipicephalus microplus]|uniref:Uncharacterized protein n=1 Tax=Rhipicephalus microplus TaxID=6941 RepID=A0A9J6DD43_RHIMP|nr:hypothetical protein HPB51_022821 [Rhipicephalus microplus]